VKYANVKNAHIVPACYLSSWEVDDQLAMRLVGSPDVFHRRAEQVGTRRRFYERERPNGDVISDIEWSLGELESNVAPVLRGFGDDWPLDTEVKGGLGQFLSFQYVRGPAFKNWYAESTGQFIEDERDGVLLEESIDEHEHDEFLASLAIHLEKKRPLRMLELGYKVSTTTASMHWTLIDFNRPWLVTSDQPVVVWPLGQVSRRPQRTPIGSGIMESLEIVIPMTPRRALLMTWLDEPDDEAGRVQGNRDLAARINAFVIASADRQWFHVPDVAVPRATGQLVPISAGLIKGYGMAAAANSDRRSEANKLIQPKIGANVIGDPSFPMVVVSRRPREA
jgi:hypothetical protein